MRSKMQWKVRINTYFLPINSINISVTAQVWARIELYFIHVISNLYVIIINVASKFYS